MPTFRLSCRFSGVPMSSISFVSRVRRDLREPAGQVENQRHYHWHLLQSRVRVEQLFVLLRALLHQLPLHVEVLQEVWVCGVTGSDRADCLIYMILVTKGTDSERLPRNVWWADGATGVVVHLVVELALFMGGRVLVLLVLGNEIVPVALRLTRPSSIPSNDAPTQENLNADIGEEIINFLEYLLNRCAIVSHFQTLHRKVADASLDVFQCPLDDTRIIVVCTFKICQFKFLVDMRPCYARSLNQEHTSCLGIACLLRDLQDGYCAVRLVPARRERRKVRRTALGTRERKDVLIEFPQTADPLAWKSEARGQATLTAAYTTCFASSSVRVIIFRVWRQILCNATLSNSMHSSTNRLKLSTTVHG